MQTNEGLSEEQFHNKHIGFLFSILFCILQNRQKKSNGISHWIFIGTIFRWSFSKVYNVQCEIVKHFYGLLSAILFCSTKQQHTANRLKNVNLIIKILIDPLLFFPTTVFMSLYNSNSQTSLKHTH